MPTAYRQIVAAAGAACHHASMLQRTAGGCLSARERDALADYAAEQRDAWLRAIERARRDEDRRRVDATLAALDYGADDAFGFGHVAHDDEDFFA